jgi:hypothetical protein
MVLLEVAAACAMLAACGGGGGNDATEGADATSAPAAAASDATTGAADTATADANAAAAPEFAGGSMEAASLAAGGEKLLGDALAPQPDPRETAQSLLNSSTAGWSVPKVAALDYSNDISSTRQALLAKFRFVILGGRIGTTLSSFSSALHARRPTIKQAYYVAFNELACSTSSSDYYYPMVQLANQAGYWLYTASGARSQWTASFNTCDMNITAWGRKDSSGWTWMQRKAQFDYNKAFHNLPYVGYAFVDNTFWRPRSNADWKRNGTNQLYTDPTLAAPVRSGNVAYWNALKGYNSNLRIIGNADNNLSYPEYAQRLNGAFFEGAIGKSWSIETWSTWDAMMGYYRAQIANTIAPKDVFFQAYGSTTDYRTMRYGLASAMLDEGWYVYLPTSGSLQPTWYDEYDAPIGIAVDPPQRSPRQNGIYMRRYTNGLVLVNPSKTATASINVGSGYKRLRGTQDPGVNNGQAQSTVTLGPRQGLLMVRQ